MTARTVYPATRIETEDISKTHGAVCKSCKVVNGAIIPAMAAGKIYNTAPANISYAAYSEVSERYFAFGDGKVYASRSAMSISSVFANVALSSPFIFGDRSNGNKTYIISGNKGVVYPSGTAPITLKYGIYGGVLKSGRLFAADKTAKYKIRWSGTGGGFDFEEGLNGAGWLNLKSGLGAIKNLVVYGENIAVLRELGITVISAYGNAETFKEFERSYYVPYIRSNTVAQTDGKLLFFTSRELYCFDGAKAYSLNCRLSQNISSPKNAVAAGSVYFVCGVYKPTGEQCVFAYDTQRDSAYIIDCKAGALLSAGDVYAYLTEGGACMLQTANEFEFISGAADFGSPYRKTLKNLEICCKEPVDITVASDSEERLFKGVKNCLRLHMTGYSFKISVTASAEISLLKAYAEVRDGI